MEGQIFSNVPALIKQAVWEPARPFRTPDVCGLQLIQRSEPRLVSASRTDPPSLLLVIVIILCVHLRLTTYGVE
jgi:hypothetical protein